MPKVSPARWQQAGFPSGHHVDTPILRDDPLFYAFHIFHGFVSSHQQWTDLERVPLFSTKLTLSCLHGLGVRFLICTHSLFSTQRRLLHPNLILHKRGLHFAGQGVCSSCSSYWALPPLPVYGSSLTWWFSISAPPSLSEDHNCFYLILERKWMANLGSLSIQCKTSGLLNCPFPSPVPGPLHWYSTWDLEHLYI